MTILLSVNFILEKDQKRSKKYFVTKFHIFNKKNF